MIFSSPIFLAFFLIVFLCYWYVLPAVLPASLRLRGTHLFLLFASYAFYMWSVPEYGLLIFASTCIDYVAGRIIGRTRADSKTEDLESNQRIRKLALIVSLLMNLGILGYYKYHDFFLTSFIEFINTLHPDAIGPGTRYELLARLILPVGISFFTFQSMSYTIDAYRGVLPAEKDFIKFALFVSFFPQLVAGPIVTAKEFLPQLQEEKTMDVDLMRQAARWFALGYFKKVVLADNMAPIVDLIYSNPYAYDTAGHWLGAFGFWIQVYCDFSGYSDMAWGAAMFLGFRLPENFRLPYLSRSVTEHWQRWHISLIRWNRDYLYFPLGGNRVSFWRHKFNVWFTMFVAGVWHGANWTFIIWGAIHGSIMAAESTWRDLKAHINARWRRKQGTDLDVEGSTRRLDGSRKSEAVRYFGSNWPLDIIRLCATSFVTIFFGTMFRAQNIDHAWMILGRMLGLQSGCQDDLGNTLLCESVGRSMWEPIAWGTLAIAVGHIAGFYFFEKRKLHIPLRIWQEVSAFIILILFMAQFGASGLEAFIYFVF